MKRPFLVWLAFAACALVGCGVLAWFTREMLRLDHESTEARRLAAVEENIRLALWRMDSALATVHGLEAARPAHDYAPFFPADAAYSSNGLEPLPDDTVLLPSPLLGSTPPFVKLHFQIEADGSIASPQAPPATLRTAVLATGVAPARLEAASDALIALRTSLNTTNLTAVLPPAPEAPFSAHALEAKDSNEADNYRSSLRRRDDAISSDKPITQESMLTAAAPAEKAAMPARKEEVVQQMKSETEQRQRANTLDLANRYTVELADSRRVQAPMDAAAAPSARAVRGETELAAAPTVQLQKQRSQASGARESAGAVVVAEADALADAGQVAAKAAGDSDTTASTVAKESTTASPDVEGPLQAVWVDRDLLFARRAVVNGHEVVQGAWLDWPELQAWLLSRVSDLLPAARLEPALPGTATTALDAARRLAFLPVQLLPGTVRVDSRALASPLRISVAIAWVGAAIGLVALALLLRGTVRLSERRGAFVSAVTHELRTPLTTFRMYTEMLAGGMVKDETKRQGYLDTLHQESARLSHLVENVLSYARLERGRAAARVEDTTPGALLARMEERLRQRALQGGLTVRVEFSDDVADLALRTDTTAVEQVLFNLVDNATKYGRPKVGGGEITVGVASMKTGRLAIRVADRGPGLTPAARKRLFQPFSKSATEAAHSQPGVGLGLALCRRLARDELHGDLVLERTGPDGTVFRVELPVG